MSKMLDLNEFTELVMCDNLIRSEGICLNDNIIAQQLNGNYEKVPDDYDQDMEYGLFAGDSKNARDHLMGILKLIVQKQGTVTQWEKEVERDLSNWVSCIDIFEYDSVLPDVLQTMVYIGCGEIVCDQMERQYRSYVDYREEAPLDEIWIPDYIELYMDFGNYTLFVMADERLAMRFYHLAACDWYGLHTSYKSKISATRKKKVERITKLVEDLDNCHDLLTWSSEKKGLPKKIVDVYNEYIPYSVKLTIVSHPVFSAITPAGN